eukprot:jgi/Ulvmu1/11221/UM072_0058.1
MHMINMLLELDAAGQLPVVVFNLNQAACSRRVLAVVGWLKACLAQHAGRGYEDLFAEQEDLKGALRRARAALQDDTNSGKRPTPEQVEQMDVRRDVMCCVACCATCCAAGKYACCKLWWCAVGTASQHG